MKFEANQQLCAVLLVSTFLLAANGVYLANPPPPNCGYESCPQPKPDMLNVHIISHTHLDVGWLKTVDQLYYGSKSYIQRAGVQYILDSVVGALLKDPQRRFIQVETAFFKQWWDNQSNSSKKAVNELVQAGRLEFIGGGWCMNDEGAAHYNAIVDQMTFGHRLLKDLFGQCGIPKIGWQIDPFGHSREQASLFAQMGFDGLFLGRIDYQDKDQRLATKTMEMVWNASANLGKKASLFTGVLYNNYSPPDGFCFDILCGDDPIIDDPRSREYNVKSRIDRFISYVNEEAEHFATNNIPITMGNDFNYQQADSWFLNLDRLIHHTNLRQTNGSKVNVFYSTPSCYLNALHKSKSKWSVKSDDFMPYASDSHSFWTGYFTSRPALKGYIRQNNNFLQACKQLDLLTGFSDETHRMEKLSVLKESMAIAQHHDAVSGTAKQAVTDDYMERLYLGAIHCQSVIDDAYQILLPLGATPAPHQQFCGKLNASECDVSENNGAFTVTVYNPFGQQITTAVRLPSINADYVVTGPNSEEIEHKIVPLPRSLIDLPERNSVATWELVFTATIPPLGFSTYFVSSSNEEERNNGKHLHVKNLIKRKSRRSDASIQNANVKVVVDGDTGLLKKVINLKEMVSVPVEQDFLYYEGMAGNNRGASNRASGAYIFRNNGTAKPISTSVTVQTFKSTMVQEIHQRFNDWVSQVIRLYEDSEHVEFDWIVGPIPVKDRIGKEIITRFDAPTLATDGIFYTDSNGREMMQRTRDYRPTWKLNLSEPEAGNYYPVNSRIYVRDVPQGIQMTLLTDRSVGGSSLTDGSLETMLHRRLLDDDAFGVDEALNEPGSNGKGLVVRGKTFLHVGNIATAAAAHRSKALQLLLAPQLSFSVSDIKPPQYKQQFKTTYSAIKTPLPPNIHILTFERIDTSHAIIRLEHVYELGEDATLSQPAIVNVPDLFFDFTITAMEETTLSANQKLSDSHRLQWKTDNNQIPQLNMKRETAESMSDDPFSIRLEPMEIRTFIITFEKPRKRN